MALVVALPLIRQARAGGWVLLGPMGVVVPVSAPGAVRPSKEACGDAARAAENHFATLPTTATLKQNSAQYEPLGRKWVNTNNIQEMY